VRARLTALLAVPVLALAVAGGGSVASAAPNDVIADYFVDGQLNGTYTVDDLRGALAFARERVGTGAQYSAFADIVSEAITRDLAGTSGGAGEAAEEQLKGQTPGTRTQVAPPPDPAAPPTATVADEGLPTPPPTDPADTLPMVVPVMGFVALGLVAIGSFSAFWRRRRRR
jgi:hypothetical protein